MAAKGNKLTPRCREAEVAEKVRLGGYVSEYSARNSNGNVSSVYSVTNSRGFVPSTDYFNKEVFSKTLTTYKIVSKGSFAYNPSRINVGSVGLYGGEDEGIVSPLYVTFTADTSKIDNQYLLAFLKSNIALRQIRNLTAGSVRDSLKFSALGKLLLPLPPLPVQRRIAAELDKICELKKNAETRLEKLDLLVKSRFVEMFGDLKSVVAIGDRFETQSGGTPKSSEKEFYENGNIPWLTSGEVGQGIVRKVDRRITQAGLDNSSAKWTPIDSVLVAMYGATAGKVGLLKIRATTNQAVCSILPAQGMIPEFVYYAVSSKTDWMIQQAAGGAQPNISQGVVRKMRIPNPPLALQREFAAFVAKVDKLRVNVRETVAKMDMLYRSKLQEYFG